MKLPSKGERIRKWFKHWLYGHKWRYAFKHGWDYSEPRDPKWRGGDFLPTQWKEYNCTYCPRKKRVYHDGFTHLGYDPDRVFIYEGNNLEWENKR